MSTDRWNEQVKTPKTCCMNCEPPKRHPGCHATCEEKKAYDEERKKKKEYLAQDVELIGYARDTNNRLYPGRKKQS